MSKSWNLYYKNMHYNQKIMFLYFTATINFKHFHNIQKLVPKKFNLKKSYFY